MKDVLLAKGVVHPERYSLGAWVKDVTDNAGVDIEIDKEFCDIYSKDYITEMPRQEALRLIAEAGAACFSQYIA